MVKSINKLDLWNAASIIETDLKSRGVGELILNNDFAEFEAVLGDSDKGEMGENFRRSLNTIPPGRFLWLCAKDAKGEIIGFVAVRHDDLSGWSLQEFVIQLWQRAFKTSTGEPVEMSPNSAIYASDIHGSIVYMGDGFVSEKWRKKGISAGLVRLLTLLAFDEWKPTIVYGWMRSHHVLGGMHMKWGFTEAYERAFDFISPPEADYHHDAYFVGCREPAIYQMIFSILKADRQAALNNKYET